MVITPVLVMSSLLDVTGASIDNFLSVEVTDKVSKEPRSSVESRYIRPGYLRC